MPLRGFQSLIRDFHYSRDNRFYYNFFRSVMCLFRNITCLFGRNLFKSITCLFGRNLFRSVLASSWGLLASSWGHDDDCSFLLFRKAESFKPIGLPRFLRSSFSHCEVCGYRWDILEVFHVSSRRSSGTGCSTGTIRSSRTILSPPNGGNIVSSYRLFRSLQIFAQVQLWWIPFVEWTTILRRNSDFSDSLCYATLYQI